MPNTVEILLKTKDEFSARFQEMRRQLDGLAAAQQKTSAATQQTMKMNAKAMADASAAARGLAQAIGVQLPEALSKAASRSATLGPILAGAFNAVAIVGFVSVLKQLPEMIQDVEGALTGWDEAAKK